MSRLGTLIVLASLGGVWAVPAVVSGAPGDFHISPAGNDAAGDGSAARPWRSLVAACKRVTEAGSVIRMAPGTYREGGVCGLAVGVSIIGAGKEHVTVIAGHDDALVRAQSTSVVRGNNVIAGFTINGNGRALDFGVQIRRRTHVTVRDMSFVDIDVTALQVSGGDASFETPPTEWVTDINIFRNRFRSCAKDYPTWTSGCLQISALKGGTIAENDIDEDRGGGIKKVGSGWFRGTQIFRNTVKVPHSDRIWGADISIELWNVGEDVLVSDNHVDSWMSFEGGNKGAGRYSIRVLRNVVQIDDFTNSKEGIEVAGVSDTLFQQNKVLNAKFGIALWGRLPSDNAVIRNNTFAGRQDGEGIRVHFGTGLSIANNTFVGLAKGIGLFEEGSNRVGAADIVNNLFLYTKHGVITLGSQRAITQINITNNLIWGGSSIWEDWGHVPTAMFAQRNFQGINPNVSIGAGYEVRPIRADSRLVDAGQLTGFRYCGNAPDIGSYEVCR